MSELSPEEQACSDEFLAKVKRIVAWSECDLEPCRSNHQAAEAIERRRLQ